MMLTRPRPENCIAVTRAAPPRSLLVLRLLFLLRKLSFFSRSVT